MGKTIYLGNTSKTKWASSDANSGRLLGAFIDDNGNYNGVPLSLTRNSPAYSESNGVLTEVGIDEPKFKNGKLLLENEATNILTYSNDFSQNAWSKIGSASIIPNTVISPDGTQNASTFVFTESLSKLEQQIQGQTEGLDYTISFYIRADIPVSIKIGAVAASVPINITTEWVRHELTQTKDSGVFSFPQIGSNGVAGSVHIYQGQLELGGKPTSEINTLGTTQTRQADTNVKTLVDLSEEINSEELVLSLRYKANNPMGYSNFTIDDNTGDVNRIQIEWSTVSDSFNVNSYSNGVFSGNTAFSYDYSLENDLVVSFVNGVMHVFVNGILIASNLNTLNPIGLKIIRFDRITGNQSFKGNLDKVIIYPSIQEAIDDGLTYLE